MKMTIHLCHVLRLILSGAIPLVPLQVVTGREINILGLNCRCNCVSEMPCTHGSNLQQLWSYQ
jgi:hypothetical protein